MSRHAMKHELRRVRRQHAAVVHGVLRARMPLQHHIHIAKQPRAKHVDFPLATLFRRSPVKAQRSRDVIALHMLLERHSRQRRSGSQQVVTASMARCIRRYRASVRYSSLREAGERVEFTKDSDHWRTLAVSGHEGGRFIGHCSLDAKSRRPQFALQESRTLLFLKT